MPEYEKFKKKVYCRTCKIDTNHHILAKHVINDDCEEMHFYSTDEYMICQCMGCDTVNFVKEYDDSNMHFSFYADDVAEYIDVEDIDVYPPKPLTDSEDHYKMKEFKHLPNLLSTLYKQVVANVELKHYLLAAAGLRMMIEGICNHLSIKNGPLMDDNTGEPKMKDGNPVRGSNLNGRINGLAEAKVLTNKSTSVLHFIRKLGNQTVHELADPKRHIIMDALEIIEQTLYNIYELKKYDYLKKEYMKKS